MRLRLLGKRNVEVRVTALEWLFLAGLTQAFDCILTHRLEHREPRLPVTALADEAVVDERGERVENAHVLVSADGLGSFERPAAREDREPRKQPPLLAAEKPVAPVDRRPKRLLALGRVTRAAGKVEPAAEPLEHRLWWEQLAARSGELDRERQSVEPRADLGDGRRAFICEREIPPDRARTLDEQRDCR